jgi:hypothetical protein
MREIVRIIERDEPKREEASTLLGESLTELRAAVEPRAEVPAQYEAADSGSDNDDGTQNTTRFDGSG